MTREDSSESSSSRSDRSNSRRSRRNRSRQNSGRNYSIDSQCGIRSVNEYQDKLSGKTKETKEAYVENRDKHGRGWAGASASDHKNGHYSSEAYAGMAGYEKENHTVLKTEASASAEFGLGGALAEADADYTIYNYKDEQGSVEAVKAYTGGGLGIGAGGVKAKMEAGVDAVKATAKLSDNQEISANLGLNANTGIEAGVDGVGVSFLGFGASVGRNTGLSTPFGSFNVKFW